MKNHMVALMATGLMFAIIISNIGSFMSDGQSLDKLRSSVLRLHIIADSDSARDQQLKLKVRDELLERGFFNEAADLMEAEEIADEKLGEIERVAELVLRKNGCGDMVTAELADFDFDERVYGSITMPAGRYRALRIKIGRAKGHNWWCVMYPPLCLPAACEGESDDDKTYEDIEENKEEEKHFDSKELDILKHPRKYRIRFAIWDKMHGLLKDDNVQSDKNKEVS